MKNIILFISIFTISILTYSFSQAKDSLQQRAEQGDKNAQFELGHTYFQEGKDYNFERGFQWWHKAANNGHVYAQHNLGAMYYEGQGLPKDIDKSIKWYTLASKQGYENSQYSLAILHEEIMNYTQAYAWASVLTHSNDDGFKEHGQEILDKIKSKMSQEDLKVAEELKTKYLKKEGAED